MNETTPTVTTYLTTRDKSWIARLVYVDDGKRRERQRSSVPYTLAVGARARCAPRARRPAARRRPRRTAGAGAGLWRQTSAEARADVSFQALALAWSPTPADPPAALDARNDPRLPLDLGQTEKAARDTSSRPWRLGLGALTIAKVPPGGTRSRGRRYCRPEGPQRQQAADHRSSRDRLGERGRGGAS